MGTQTETRVEDIFEKLLRLIETDELGGAKALFYLTPSIKEQIDILAQLANRLARDLDRANDLDLILTLDLTSASALARDLTRALGALANDHYGALDLTSASALASALTPDLTSALTSALGLARALDHALDREFALYLDSLIRLLEKSIKVNDFIEEVLREMVRKDEESTSKVKQSGRVSVVLSGVDILTPDVLVEQVGPYLKAWNNLAAVIAEIQEEEHKPIRIYQISQNSPLSLDLGGAGEVYETVSKDISSKKREHRDRMMELEETKALIETQQQEIDLLKSRQETRQHRELTPLEKDKLSQEIEALRLQNEHLKLDLEKRQIEIANMRIDLAQNILSRFEGDLDNAKRAELIERIMESTLIILSSPLMIDG